jgi:hypothetical protein
MEMNARWLEEVCKYRQDVSVRERAYCIGKKWIYVCGTGCMRVECGYLRLRGGYMRWKDIGVRAAK